MMPTDFKGETYVTLGDRTVECWVKLASDNGRSLMLEFDAMLGGYVGSMPVLWDEEDHVYRELLGQEEVKIDWRAQ